MVELTLICLVLGLFFIILLAPTIEFKVKLRRRAKADYLSARGTVHRDIVQDCLANLNREVSGLYNEIQRLKSRSFNLKREKERELEVKLTAQIVDKELEKIPGIGRVLRDRIIRRCFDGTLESLNRALYVHGIGEEKSYAIRRWVRGTRSKMPQLLLGDFPGKPRIIKKYAELDSKIEQELKTNNLRLQGLQQLRSEAVAALDSLGPVDVSTFIDAHKGDGKAAETVTRYLVGVFPEWRRMPKWFKTLMETYGAA